ncbi:MAG: M24 family metallopeptidase [Alphaproteobacteria bacterium]|nr:M24 family metallopeptidase [Alphaproteobacteria bacterium]
MASQSIDPAVVDAFDDAQRRGWRLLSDVARQVVVGMTEVDIAALARERLSDHGFDRWYHAPEVAVGERTRRPPHRHSARARVQAGDFVTIDLGPATADTYADVGVTLHVAPEGEPEPELLEVTRDCVRGCVGYASQWKTVGEIFVFARAWAVNHRVELASTRAIGHAVLPKAGPLAVGFPRSAHAANLLRRNQMHFLHPVRLQGMWAIRPLISDGQRAASFEEIIFVDGEDKRILGRDSLDEVGTLPD